MRGYGPASYGDSFADVYDRWYADVGDVEGCVAAVAAAAGGRRVLELGVGTGRLALPLQDAGVEVVGVDASAAMVRQLAAKDRGATVRAVLGDMAALPLRGPFTGVVVGFNSLFNLTTAEAQLACFHEVARVLEPGGFFAAELFVPATEDDVPDAVVEPSRVDLDRVVLTASVRDRERQLVEGQHIEITESGIRLHPWVVRYAHPEELDEMATAAGLELARRDAGWRGEPYGPTTTQHISWWRRPPAVETSR